METLNYIPNGYRLAPNHLTSNERYMPLHRMGDDPEHTKYMLDTHNKLKVGGQYKTPGGYSIIVTEIQGYTICYRYADRWGYDGETCTLEVNSMWYDKIVKLSENPNGKELKCFWSGGYPRVCDCLCEDRGEYKTYASFQPDGITYYHKEDLTPAEIRQIKTMFNNQK